MDIWYSLVSPATSIALILLILLHWYYLLSRLNSINAIYVSRVTRECRMSISPLVHCSIGPFDHWFIGPLVHWSKCQKSIRLNFCRSVPPDFLRSFLSMAACGMILVERLSAVKMNWEFMLILVVISLALARDIQHLVHGKDAYLMNQNNSFLQERALDTLLVSVSSILLDFLFNKLSKTKTISYLISLKILWYLW